MSAECIRTVKIIINDNDNNIQLDVNSRFMLQHEYFET